MGDDILTHTKVSRVLCDAADWYRFRAWRESGSATRELYFPLTGTEFHHGEQAPPSHGGKAGINPPRLSDSELADRFLEIARRIRLARAYSNKSD